MEIRPFSPMMRNHRFSNSEARVVHREERVVAWYILESVEPKLTSTGPSIVQSEEHRSCVAEPSSLGEKNIVAPRLVDKAERRQFGCKSGTGSLLDAFQLSW